VEGRQKISGAPRQTCDLTFKFVMAPLTDDANVF